MNYYAVARLGETDNTSAEMRGDILVKHQIMFYYN